MRKKAGKQFTLYLPESLVAKAKVMADERDRSTSFVVACALREYFNAANKNAPLGQQSGEASLNASQPS